MTVELTVRPALRRCGRKVPYSIVSHTALHLQTPHNKR
jgi:hypothetical protein